MDYAALARFLGPGHKALDCVIQDVEGFSVELSDGDLLLALLNRAAKRKLSPSLWSDSTAWCFELDVGDGTFHNFAPTPLEAIAKAVEALEPKTAP